MKSPIEQRQLLILSISSRMCKFAMLTLSMENEMQIFEETVKNKEYYLNGANLWRIKQSTVCSNVSMKLKSIARIQQSGWLQTWSIKDRDKQHSARTCDWQNKNQVSASNKKNAHCTHNANRKSRNYRERKNSWSMNFIYKLHQHWNQSGKKKLHCASGNLKFLVKWF